MGIIGNGEDGEGHLQNLLIVIQLSQNLRHVRVFVLFSSGNLLLRHLLRHLLRQNKKIGGSLEQSKCGLIGFF